MVMGGLTKDAQCSRRCERMLILLRRDAKETLSLDTAAKPSRKHATPSGGAQHETMDKGSLDRLEATLSPRTRLVVVEALDVDA